MYGHLKCVSRFRATLYYLGISRHISLIDPFKARCLLHICALLDVTPKLCILLMQLTFAFCMILTYLLTYSMVQSPS